jgi:multimeric flavodoxin WrbA
VKVLGVASSPRRAGNTDLLLQELLKGASTKGASTEFIALRELKYSTCLHCDTCLKTGECKLKDDMRGIYDKLAEADVIVLASPVQFAGPTAPLKAMIDRCQSLWARKYVLKTPPLMPEKKRRGFFISVAGRKSITTFEPSIAIIKTYFHVINVEYAGELTVNSIDEKGAILRHPDIMLQAFQWGEKLASGE